MWIFEINKAIWARKKLFTNIYSKQEEAYLESSQTAKTEYLAK